MRLTITAKPGKKKEFVEQISPTHYIVSVKEKAERGKANQAIVDSLSKYFGVSRAEITLVSGQTGRQKIVEVPDHLANFEPLPKQKMLF